MNTESYSNIKKNWESSTKDISKKNVTDGKKKEFILIEDDQNLRKSI